MNAELPKIIEELKAITDDAKATFGALSSDKLNWKPAADSWSVAQCLDHLIKSNEEYNPVIEKLKNGEFKPTLLEKLSPFSGFFGKFLVKSLANDAKKFKVPTQAIAPPSDLPGDIVEKFSAHQWDLGEKIKSVDTLDWQKTVITSPLMKIMTYSLGKTFEIAVVHEKRHIRQAKRVMEMEGFPK